jgi:hypothetical protein
VKVIIITSNTVQQIIMVTFSGYDYIENSCMAEPRKLCDIKKINNRKLVAVDDLFEGVENKTTCEQLCLNANYR